MKKLSYAIICSTALVMTCIAHSDVDRFITACFATSFGVACLMTNEKEK